MAHDWKCYLIENRGATYVGVSPDPTRRLRQHNGEISGGAKYTASKGDGWTHVCIVEGFRTKTEALQFEWAVKHVAPRNAGGLSNRIKKLYVVCARERWTSKAPPAHETTLVIHWHRDVSVEHELLPPYVTEHVNQPNLCLHSE
jgi:predicted GIY-YIG superfamily endonuclease